MDYARNSQKWHLLNLFLSSQYNAIYAFVEDYYTCSGIFNGPVIAGMDNAGKSRSGIYDVYFCLP